MALFLLYLFFLKFKVYNVMIVEYPFSEQPSFHIDTTLKNKKKIFFFMMRTIGIYSLITFIYNVQQC